MPPTKLISGGPRDRDRDPLRPTSGQHQESLAATSPTTIGGCPVLPPEQRLEYPDSCALPVDAASTSYITTIGATKGMHADFGAGL